MKLVYDKINKVIMTLPYSFFCVCVEYACCLLLLEPKARNKINSYFLSYKCCGYEAYGIPVVGWDDGNKM